MNHNLLSFGNGTRLVRILVLLVSLGLTSLSRAETVTTTTLAPGAVYYRISYDSLSGGKQQVYILDVDLKKTALEFKMPHLSGSFRTTSQHATVTINGALAAINGQYFDSAGSICYLRVGGSLINTTDGGHDIQAIVDDDNYTQNSVRILRRPTADWGSLPDSSIMSAGPDLINDGVKRTSYNMADDLIASRHPRTAAAWTYENHMLLIVVDGRSSIATGMTIPELRDYIDSLESRHSLGDIRNAFNFDGGGSGTFWTSTGVKNVPSDGAQRPVANAVVVVYNPRMDVFVRQTSDNTIRRKYWTGVDSWSASWDSLGAPSAGAASDPSVVARGYRKLDIFVRGADGWVYQSAYNGSSWSSWASIGTGTVVGSPDACSWGASRMDVVARSAYNTLLHKSWDGTNWTAWSDLGGNITSDPSAVSWGPNRVDVFARGTTGGLAHISMVSGSAWSAWEDLGGALQGGPDACSASLNKLHVFYRGTDNAVKWRSYTSGGSWSAVTNLGATTSADPGATSYESGHLQVYARNSSGAVIKRRYINGNWDASWNSDLGGAITGGPDAASWSNSSDSH